MCSRTVNVLLVEDDEEDYLITRRLLSQIKPITFALDWVATYEAALESIANHQHDIYLVDYRLGPRDGLEFLQAALANGCRTPIILLTGQSNEDVDLAAMKAGAADYLVKGQIDAALLERSIRYAIERNRTLEALHKSEAQLEGILGSLKDVVWSAAAPTFEMLYMSAAVHTLYGRSASEFAANPNLWFEVVHPDDRAWASQAAQALWQSGAKDLEYRILQPDGAIRWVRDRAYLVCDASWKTTRINGIVTDITQRKQGEASLKQAVHENSQLAAAIAHIGTGVMLSDPTLPDNPIIFANPGFTAITGYTTAAVLGKNCRFLQGPETDPDMMRAMRQAIAQHQPFTGTLLNYRQDGTPFWNELTLSPVFGDDGTLINFVGLQTDVTARKQAEAELQTAKEAAEAATQVKSDFLANMSHEIRTPMNGVIGMTELLLETTLTPPQRDFVETIRSSGDALLTIINDILDFSKIESGKLALEQQPLDLRACIEECLDLLGPKAAAKGLELAYLFNPQTPTWIEGDVTRLRQILVNLLGNAIKFTETGEVLVSVIAQPASAAVSAVSPALAAHQTAYELQFAIKDTGIGIPSDRMTQLFQPFTQVDTSTSRKYGGTGLGLVISKELSALMGGSIWVESQVGQGSTFYFTIQATAIPGSCQNDIQALQPQLDGKRLLIVDDNATNRNILTLQAQAWGMQSRAAQSGVEALDWLRQGEHFDLAVLDLQMPQMDGLTLATEMQKLPTQPTFPMVMLTSMNGSGVEAEAATRQFAAFLNKPIRQAQLYSTLVQALGRQPLKCSPACPIAPPMDAPLAPRLPLRLLLAEDNMVNQKLALLFLNKLGYGADVAETGLEVLAALQRQSYDVVLMDVQMPEMDGLTATRQICQQWAPAFRPRIIAMTANAMQGDREECLQAGMDDYISKPIRVEALVQALSQCQPIRHKTAPPTVDPQPPAPPVLDPTALQAIREAMGEDAHAVVTELIACYLTEAPKLLQGIDTAMTQQNASNLNRAAHTLKSSSAALGAMTLSHFCQALETSARTGAIDNEAGLVPLLHAEYERVRTALQLEQLSA